jgi:hypothetical protein
MPLKTLDITNQIVNPDLQAINLRDNLGRFAPGISGNPGGRPLGWAKPSHRLAIILNEQTVREIKSKVGDENQLGIEATVYQRAAAAIDGDRQDAEFVFGYLEGKPTQKQELTGKDGGPLAIATADVSNLLLELSNKATE